MYPALSARLSCVICAYNEGPRLAAVLAAATGHPLIDEVIVVDDGSTDDTALVASHFPGVRLVAHGVNRGKSAAMATGVVVARNDWLMLLDADLKGLRPEHLSALARPVLEGNADCSLSLRGNSLRVFRAAGMDFVSGERVVPRELLLEMLDAIAALPRFGIEVTMNRRIIERRLRVSVVDWRDVMQTRKAEKLGWWRGTLAEWRMVGDLMRAASPLELLAQTWRMTTLRRPGRGPAELVAGSDT